MMFARFLSCALLVASAFATSAPTSSPTTSPAVVSTTVTTAAIKGTSIISVADITGIEVGDKLYISSATGDKTEENWVKTVTASRRLATARTLATAGKITTVNPLSQTFAAGSKVTATTPSPSPSCFPGESQVLLEGSSSPILLRELKAGDFVQVNGAAEEVLGFIHSLEGRASQMSIEHAAGELRASGNHVLYTKAGEKTASNIVSGDELIMANGQASLVLSVREDTTEHGMIAPITTSGSVAVDNVMASNYAVVANLPIPHSAMHAAFFAVRALHQVGFSFKSVGDSTEKMHPLPAFYQRVLGLDKLLKQLS